MTCGAGAGAVAGVLAAWLDVASTVLWLAAGREPVRLVAAFSFVGAGAGAVAGALGAAVWSVRIVHGSWRTQLARGAAVVAVPLAFVAWWLFRGGHARRLPALPIWIAASWVAMVAVASLALAVGTRTVRFARVRGGAARVGVFVVAAAIAQGAHAMDHRIFPRLYEYLHVSLGAITWLACVAAVLVAIGRHLETRTRRRMAVPWVSIALLPIGVLLLDRWENVRAEVYGVHAPFVRHAVVAIDRMRTGGVAETFDARRATYLAERSRTHTAVGAGPVFPRAHVLLITIDALRNDRVGPRPGRASLTPALDALAARGTRFQRTYAQAPHSSYSLASLHTSEYLHETVALGQPQPLATMADAFARAGYHTAALFTHGVFFTESERLLPYRDSDFGFRRADHVDRRAPEQTEAAEHEIDDIVARGEPPTLLWVHYFDAHEPYGGTGATAEDRYDDAVRRADGAVARLLAYAERRCAREWIVAVTADHGEEFHEHGGVYHGSSLYEEQVRVPWILAVPQGVHRAVASPVESVDIAPTLLRLAGIVPPPSMRGRDLRGGTAAMPDATVFAAVNTRTMALRWPWKLVADLRFGVRELYDLESDPAEAHNLADRESARVAQLGNEIAAWIESLGRSGAVNSAIARARMGDPSALPALADVAADRRVDSRTRLDALHAIADADARPVLERIAPLLRERSTQIADAAATAMASAGDARAVRPLRDAVTRDDPASRAAASLVVVRVDRDHAPIATLADLLHQRDESARRTAIDALGDTQSPEAFEPLAEQLDDDNVRYRAVRALGRLGDPRAIPLLTHIAAHDRGADIRESATLSLRQLQTAPSVGVGEGRRPNR